MTEKIRPKNIILNYTAVIVGIILCVGLSILVKHADSLDKVVLLEDRNRIDYQLGNGTIYSCGENETNNLLLLNYYLKDYIGGSSLNGVSLLFGPDSSISLKGISTADTVIPFSFGNYLVDGQYIFSVGGYQGILKSISLYIEGWDETSGTRNTIATIPDNTVFQVDHNKYDNYWFGLYIPKGLSLDGTKYYPMISKYDRTYNQKNDFEPAWIQGGSGQYKKYIVEINSNDELNADRLDYLRRVMKYQENDCNSAEVILNDNNYIRTRTYSIEQLNGVKK